LNPLRKIGGRMFLTFTAVFVLVVTGLGISVVQFAQKTINQNAGNELRILSVTLSSLVQKRLNRIEESLTSIEEQPGIVEELRKQKPDRKVIEDFLRARLKILPLFQDMAVFNRTGQCVASTDPEICGLAGKTQPFFVQGLKGFNFSDILTKDEEKAQLVSMPIMAGAMTKGVLIGEVNLASIYDLMDQRLGISETTDAFLLDSALRFITPGKTGIDKQLESHLVATPLIGHLREEFWVDRYKNYGGREVLGTVMRIPGRKWYVVVERDIDEVIKPINDVKKVISVTVLALIAVLILVTYALTRSITGPLRQLVDGTQRIAKGDFGAPVDVPTGIDEVQFLAEEIDKMRAKIQAFQERMIERLEVSEKRRIENERLAAIGTLASTLAHEIRNPLNGMALLLSRLEYSRSSPNGTAVFDGVIRDLRGEISRLDRLVRDILDYARPVALDLRDLDLRQLIDSTLEIYRGPLEAKRVTVKVDMPLTPVRLKADGDKVKQCLVNLVQNAIDAVSAGGTIGIEARVNAETIDLCVRDDGVGLPQGSESRLFDLFFTTKEQGTGLGLTTVKKIVDAHGGQIILQRRTPGTEVRLVFPRNSQF
jgi:signal transduction histidine kinase